MTQYHRIQNNRLMLVTTVTLDRAHIFEDPACARQVIESLYSVQCVYPFFLYAFVVMPDHVHLLVRVPDGGSISRVMHAFKRAVAFEIGRKIWQPRFDCRLVRNADAVICYIHHNPVRAALCDEPSDYPWSSASGRWDTAA